MKSFSDKLYDPNMGQSEAKIADGRVRIPGSVSEEASSLQDVGSMARGHTKKPCFQHSALLFLQDTHFIYQNISPALVPTSIRIPLPPP